MQVVVSSAVRGRRDLQLGTILTGHSHVIKRRMAKFDARQLHQTLPYHGIRYSITFYTQRAGYQPKAVDLAGISAAIQHTSPRTAG